MIWILIIIINISSSRSTSSSSSKLTNVVYAFTYSHCLLCTVAFTKLCAAEIRLSAFAAMASTLASAFDELLTIVIHHGAHVLLEQSIIFQVWYNHVISINKSPYSGLINSTLCMLQNGILQTKPTKNF